MEIETQTCLLKKEIETLREKTSAQNSFIQSLEADNEALRKKVSEQEKIIADYQRTELNDKESEVNLLSAELSRLRAKYDEKIDLSVSECVRELKQGISIIEAMAWGILNFHFPTPPSAAK